MPLGLGALTPNTFENETYDIFDNEGVISLNYGADYCDKVCQCTDTNYCSCDHSVDCDEYLCSLDCINASDCPIDDISITNDDCFNSGVDTQKSTTDVSGDDDNCENGDSQNLGNDFKIGCLNVRSLHPKFDEITEFVKSNKFDIFIINESWLDGSFSDGDINIFNYDVVRRDRNRQGGGVCMYLKSSLKYKVLHNFGTIIESLWVHISIDHKEFVIGTIYRPPSSNNEYCEEIFNEIERLKSLYTNIVLLGDLNYDYNEFSKSNPVYQIEDLFCMNQLVEEPTPETLTGSSLIDIILTTVPECHSNTNVLKVSMSDHYCIQTRLKCFTSKESSHNLVTFRNYKDFDKGKYLQEIAAVFNETNLNNLTIIEIWNYFKQNFLQISERHVPLETRRLKNRYKPWITHDIVRSMYKRDHLKSKAVKYKCPNKWNEYKNLRNEITGKIRKAKKEYFRTESLQCASNPKATWKLLNKVTNNRNMVSPPEELSAKDFNEYFSTIGENTARKYFSNSNDGSHPWKGPNFTSSKFKFTEVAISTVHKLLTQLGESSSTDILGFDCKLLQLSTEIISPILTKLINVSLQEGYVIDEWKISKVTPVFKGGDDKFDKNNYRPISVISHFAKILEKVVQRQLVEYLMDHELICIDQSAYKRYHNTQTSLHRCTEDWIDNICDKTYTAICFLDIRKCFDTIDHTILLNKLARYGIDDTEALWFASYLKNRSQHVKCNGNVSAKCFVPIGVPQGSVLGPVLFSLFVNDITCNVYPSTVNLYADDTLLYCTGSDVNEASQKLQLSLNEVSNWYNGNRLALNASKSSCMVIGSKYQTRTDNNLNVMLNNEKIEQVNKVKYLGVMIDNNLTWNEHISVLCKNLSYKISQLSRVKNIVTKDMMLTIYRSIIQPTIDYAITVWGHTTMENISKIQRLQNMAARIILDNFDYVNVRGINLVKQLKWMNITERIIYFEQLLMFKCIHGMAPDYLSNEITMEIEIRNINTRSHDMNVYIPFPNNEFSKKSLFYSAAKNWNDLPDEMKEITNIENFKQKLKSNVHMM
jgi:hypothetical protein